MIINGTVCGKVTAENGKIFIPVETDKKKYVLEAYGEAGNFTAFGEGITICTKVRRITSKTSDGNAYVYHAEKISIKL